MIARADGSVLYNFAVAVDDLDAGDHPRGPRRGPPLQHAEAAAGVRGARRGPPPRYAHLPLLHGPDGSKLSKRHGAASVQELREAGYLPEAVDNYIALLGAGFAADEEHFTLAELAERFRLERVSKNPAVFDERKLRHINGRHLRELGLDELTRRLEEFTGRSGLRGAVEISAEKIQTLADFWPLVGFLFDGPGRRPGRLRQGDLGRGRRRNGWTRPVPLAWHRAVQRRERRSRRYGESWRALNCEAGRGIPAGSRGDRRHDGLAGHLRERGAAGPRRDAGPHRSRPS